MGQFLRVSAAVALGWAAALAPAHASETITYTYDALGRLITAHSSGSVNNNQNTSISYDSAGNRTNYNVTGAGPATPTISIGNKSVTEGGTLAFQVTLSAAQSSAVSASYASANGIATAGSDYTAVSGTLTIAAGQTSGTINVTTIDDAAVESVETLTVTISAPTGGVVLGTATGTGTINDNDTPANLAIGNASATEGGTLAFTVTRSGNTATAASANYATAGGSATSGSDFTAASGTISFAANQTAATINVATINDTAVEATETMTVTLSSPSNGAAITTATGTGTIIDNDVAWTSSLTSGTWSYCYGTCTYIYGYVQNLTGSITNTAFNAYTVTGVYNVNSSTVYLTMSGSAVPPNSGWTSIAIPGVGTLIRSSATYTTGTNSATWAWANASHVTSGTVTIQ